MRRIRALAAILGILLAGPAGAADLEDGVAAYERGDYQAAIDAWMPLADANDVDALFNMGQLYRMGKGVSRDPVMAEYFYRRAAERGHASAQGNLGTLYYFGFDDSPRVAEALEWWQKAARGGDVRSQYMLGILYYNGQHLPRDPVRAYAWIRKASVAGLPEAVEAEKKLIRALSVKELAAGNNLAPRVQDLPIETVGFAAPEEEMQVAPEAKVEVAEEVPAAEEAAAPEPEAITGYYVQLAALASAARAETVQAQLAGSHDALTSDRTLQVEEARLEDGRTVYRLLLGAFAARADAAARCARLKDEGQDCFVVKR